MHVIVQRQRLAAYPALSRSCCILEPQSLHESVRHRASLQRSYKLRNPSRNHTEVSNPSDIDPRAVPGRGAGASRIGGGLGAARVDQAKGRRMLHRQSAGGTSG